MNEELRVYDDNDWGPRRRSRGASGIAMRATQPTILSESATNSSVLLLLRGAGVRLFL